MLTICLIPDQKVDARRRLRMWPRHWAYAAGATLVVLVGFWYGSLASFLQLTDLTSADTVSRNTSQFDFLEI